MNAHTFNAGLRVIDKVVGDSFPPNGAEPARLLKWDIFVIKYGRSYMTNINDKQIRKIIYVISLQQGREQCKERMQKKIG